MKELTLGVATFALAVFAMQSVASAQTSTVSPTVAPTRTTTPSPTSGSGVTIPAGAPSTGFGGN